ncbi:MAG: glutathione S-transferase family protein [Halioglobus sp.]|nr:glutathione S-transferase family protein [Halioglobus sp.]
MKLYHFPPAPNPAKVLAYIREKGLDEITLELVDFFQGEQNSPEHLARSPRGTVPVLELDDGTCLTESLPIIEYLEELYPEPPMIGSTPLERARTRARERYIELNVTNRLVRLVHAANSPIGLPANPALAENERKHLPGALAYVDELVGAGPFVMGERPTIADCTLLAGFNFANIGQLDTHQGYTNLDRWFEMFALRHL